MDKVAVDDSVPESSISEKRRFITEIIKKQKDKPRKKDLPH